VDVTAPTFTGSYSNVPLGCNPGTPSSSLGSATATDACGTITNITSSDGSIVSAGCNRSLTRTFTAIDACNNSSTVSRTVTWTDDITPPVFTGTYTTVSLGCNPASPSTSLGSATATDVCGATTISSSDGAIVTNGCDRTQTRTFTAIDACNNSSTTSRTVTWTVDLTPPTFTGSSANASLGCNPSNPAGSLGTATATDACGAVTITSSDGAIVTTGCNRSLTRTFTAKDACNNSATTSQTVTWTADVTPPTFTGSYTTVSLGCNPASPSSSLGSATATDACGATTITSSDGPTVTTGCGRSITRTFTAIDACSNSSTTSRTVTWTDDNIAPTFTGSYSNVSLGCNPASPSSSLGSATATDACGATTITQSDGAIVTTGCDRSQTRTFTARDACNNSSTTSRTVTWTVDVTAPVLSCPATQQFCITAGPNYTIPQATATDNCGGAVTLTYVISGATTGSGSGGNASGSYNAGLSTITWTATDACGNTSTCSVNVTIATPITITQNPASISGCKTAGNSDVTFTAQSTSGSPGPTAQWQVSADGTNYTNLTTGTTNTSTIAGVTTSSYTFTPSQSDMEKFYRVIFTNACGSAISTGAYLFIGENITLQPGQNDFNIQIVACDQATACVSLTYTTPQNVFGYVHARLEWGPSGAGPWSFLFEDSTIGPGTTTQTKCFPVTSANNGWYLRWKVWNYGCEEYHAYPLPIIIYPKAVVTTVNSCVGGGSVTFTENVVPPGGTWTINGGGNIDASTGVFTPTTPGCWRAIFTAAQPAICADTAMFVVFPAVSAPVVNTGCGPIIVTPPATVAGFNIEYSFDDGVTWGANNPPTAENCTGYKIKTRYVTTGVCASIPAAADDIPAGTASTTACPSPATTRSIDLTPPAFTGAYGPVPLGCNPSSAAITAALGTATATDACGTPTVSFTDGALQSAGCGRSQTRTFTARDGCNNTSTTSRTVTWTSDNIVTIIASGTTLSPGCNPTAAAINAALGSATSTDACSTPTVTQTDGPITTTGCNRSQTRSWSIIDGCSNTASTSRTVTWTVDLTPPTISATGTALFLCKPVGQDLDNALGTATGTDNCVSVTISATDNTVSVNGCISTQTRTFTATDACGNTATTSRTVSWTTDNNPPTFTGTYSPVSLGCNPTSSDITAALSPVTATDNCGTPTVTSVDGPIVTNVCSRSQTRTFTATDLCGNSATVARTVSWTIDVTAPVISGVGAPLTISCPATPSFSSPTASDACGTPSITFTDATTPGTCTNNYTVTRTFKATDACGNTATASQAITVVDNTPPTLIGVGGPSTINCPATPSFSFPTASDGCSAASVTFTDATTPGTCANNYTITRTFKATDACGNTATASQAITVIDNTPPTLSGVGGPSTINCPATPSFSSPTASDGCSAASVTFTDATTPGTCANNYTITRTFKATDACGNTATASQAITVVDNTPPTLSGVGGPSTINCPATPSFSSPTASDGCSAASVTFTDATTPGTCANNYTITRTFKATDACGNTATASQAITVVDNTPPTLSGVGGPSTINCPATPSFSSPTASDGCSAASVTFTDATTPGTCANNYTITRTFKATDACGNTATASQAITVVDNTPPTLSGVGGPSTINCPATPSFSSPTASDGCSAASVTFTDATTPGTCANNYTITRTFKATDACGNTATATQAITVVDNTPPTLSGVGGPSTINCPATPSFSSPTASDGCGAASVTFTDATTPGTCANNYTITRTFKATDACGNTATATQAITVVDNTPPTLSGVGGPSTINCPATPSFSSPTASDACGAASVTFTDATTPGTCANNYTITEHLLQQMHVVIPLLQRKPSLLLIIHHQR
jgi:hypothetical protein